MAIKLYDEANIQAIADAIRDKTKTDTKYKPAQMAAGVNEVYEKGVDDEYNRFWDIYQANGERNNYNYAFYNSWWTDESFKPKYDIKSTYGEMIFYGSSITDLVKSLKDHQVTLDLSKAKSMYRTFMNTDTITLPELDFSNADSLSNTFRASKVVTIPKMIITNKCTSFKNPFQTCTALQTLIIEGEIAGSGLDFSDCTKLTTVSLLSILTALSKDSSLATGNSITFSTKHKTTIEADTECAAQLQLAKNAGWTIAYA